MVKSIIVTTLLLLSSPVFAFESTDEGIDFFNEALKNVKEYHLQQTRTDPEDALDDALDNFWNTYEQ